MKNDANRKTRPVAVLLEPVGFFTQGRLQEVPDRSVRNVKPTSLTDRFYFADRTPQGRNKNESKIYFIGEVLGEKAVKSRFNNASRRADVLRALKRSPDKKIVLTKMGNVIDLDRAHTVVLGEDMKRVWPKKPAPRKPR